MATFEELKIALTPEMRTLREAFIAKQEANKGGASPSEVNALTQRYSGLQFQLDQKLRARGLKGSELDVALKAIMEIVQKQAK